MTIISAYQDSGAYRGAAAICGTTPKTVKRVTQEQELNKPQEVGLLGWPPAGTLT
jgi:hypothetical protein